MIKRLSVAALVTFSLAGCSSGGGDGGSSGSSTAGFIGAPSATCGGQSCVPGASISGNFAPQFLTTDPDRAVALYEAFNNSFISKLNQFLAKVYAGMVAGGSTSCSDVLIGSSGTVNGYGFSITSSNKNIPAGFTKSGTPYGYRIYASHGETPVAEIQVYCGAETTSDPLTVTARVNEDGAKYEFTYEKSGNQIRVMGAGILSSDDRMIAWFKTDDGNAFDLDVKSKINGVPEYYHGTGDIAANKYRIQEDGGTDICFDASGGTIASCTGVGSLNTPPSLSMTTALDWTDDVSTFTIHDP